MYGNCHTFPVSGTSLYSVVLCFSLKTGFLMYGNGHTFPVTGISLNLWDVTETWGPPESYSFSFTAGIVISY